MCCDKLEHGTQFLRQLMTRTNTPLSLPAAHTEFGWWFVLPPPASWELQAPPWELKDILLTPKQKSPSSGWNSRISCWCFLLPWGLVLDMSLQHVSILFWLLAAAVCVARHTGIGWDVGWDGHCWLGQHGGLTPVRLLSAAATQIRIQCSADAWN